MRALLIFADLRLLSIFQKIAWKAGHKKVCVPNEATSQNEVASPKAATLLELRLLQKINTHYEARDWRGVVELEGEAVAVATALRGRTPMLAADIYHALGVSLQYLRNPRATMMHWEQKAIGECMGDSAVVARACVNLGGCLQSSKEYKQGIKVLQQAKAIAEEKGEKRLARSAGGRASASTSAKGADACLVCVEPSTSCSCSPPLFSPSSCAFSTSSLVLCLFPPPLPPLPVSSFSSSSCVFFFLCPAPRESSTQAARARKTLQTSQGAVVREAVGRAATTRARLRPCSWPRKQTQQWLVQCVTAGC